MAELPIESPDMQMQGPLLPGSNFIKGAVGMPVVRQGTLLIALAASVSLGIFATEWMQTPDYKPLGSAFSLRETDEITQVLQAGQIDYQLDQRTGIVSVPADEIYSARMMLAGADLIGSGQSGYELLDKEQGFGVSSFMENARHRRSVEGELAKNIAIITAV